MLAKSWAKLSNVRDHVENFIKEGNFSLLLVLGFSFEEDKKERDLIIIGEENSPLYKSISGALEKNTDPSLELQKEELENYFLCYNQLNIAASRKQIMPIVKNALSN